MKRLFLLFVVMAMVVSVGCMKTDVKGKDVAVQQQEQEEVEVLPEMKACKLKTRPKITDDMREKMGILVFYSTKVPDGFVACNKTATCCEKSKFQLDEIEKFKKKYGWKNVILADVSERKPAKRFGVIFLPDVWVIGKREDGQYYEQRVMFGTVTADVLADVVEQLYYRWYGKSLKELWDEWFGKNKKKTTGVKALM